MKTRLLRSLLLLVLGLELALLSTGCTSAPVRPWERVTLSSYAMRADRDPLATAANEHIFFSRESASGGRGVGGGGCGCN